jgi:Domain of unknown function (DUF4388)
MCPAKIGVEYRSDRGRVHWGVIHGTFDRLHFGDLLQWLQMGGVSGRLTLRDARGERRLDFAEGRICYASSTLPEERLASWLAGRSLISADDLRRILAASMLRRAYFTDLLIAEGGVTEEGLRISLIELAETITSRILTAQHMEFTFEPDHPVLDILGLSLDVEPGHLLLAAARRTDEDEITTDEGGSRDLTVEGEAFESLFWNMARAGINGDDPVDGERMSELHDLVRDIVGTLAQWLATSPGLVPSPSGQIEGLVESVLSGEPVCFSGLPHTAWNQMVLACTVHSSDAGGPLTLDALEEIAATLDLWEEMAGSEFLRRPDAGRLDDFIGRGVATWSRAAAAAAPHLGVDPATATLAAHLAAVPTDLVLWVLTTLPVPHQGFRKTLLVELSRRVGSRLAHLADFPVVFREILNPLKPTPLGACLHLGRECLPSTSTWPVTIPDDGECMLEIASASALASAADAAREVAEASDTEILAAG